MIESKNQTTTETSKLKKQIILYGAYDRYNYGDNLMPIIFRMYIEKYHPNILNNFQLTFCSIGESDLSKYDCYKTSKIKSVLDSAPDGSLLVVIGGEVLCASNLALFLHMQNSDFMHGLVKTAKFFLRRHLTLITKKVYGTDWEFPYIPPKIAFKNDVKIAYNTVGGEISSLPLAAKKDVISRLNSADYISVRDKRTEKNLSNINDINLYPDSVFLISDIISTNFLADKVHHKIKSIINNPYFCFQASPHKVGDNIENVVRSLKKISEKRKEKIVLLPIGYASGHDDTQYLESVAQELHGEAIVLKGLNVWEIMYAIRNSQLFIGTSLHGIITAMAFNIPHFGLNPEISKVNSFLKDWSIAPFNKSLELEKISDVASNDYKGYQQLLTDNSYRIAELVKKNNENILSLCNKI